MRVLVFGGESLGARVVNALPQLTVAHTDRLEGVEPGVFDVCVCAVADLYQASRWASDAISVVGVADSSEDGVSSEGVELLLPEELSERALLRAREHNTLHRNLQRLRRGHERLARTLSHDFQAPLRQVSQFAELLREDYGDRLDDRAHRWLGFISAASARSQSMVRSVREYVKSVGPDVPELFSLDEALRLAVERAELLGPGGLSITQESLPSAWGHGPSIAAVFQTLLSRVAFTHREVAVRGWVENARSVVEILATQRREQGAVKPRGEEIAIAETLILRFSGEVGVLEGARLRFSLPAAAPC